MAEETRESTDSLKDEDLLNEAFSEGEPEAPVEEPQVEEPEEVQAEDEAQTSPERDEKGRFKAKEADEPQEPEKATEEAATEPEQPMDDDGGKIPSWRLKEEADAKRAAEDRARQLEQQNAQINQQLQSLQQQVQSFNQPKQEPIDPYENPEGWQKQQQDTLQQTLLNERLNMSESMARLHYGDETVDAALQWANTIPPYERQAILNARNPYGELVSRKQKADTLAEIGTDPKAYRERVLADAMKDPEFVKSVLEQAKTEAASRPEQHVTKLPASLNKAQTASDAKSDAGNPETVPMSDGELLADAMRR